jgi:hypothetical protein
MANNEFLTKVATVLEALAVHLDNVENEKAATVASEKSSIITALADKYASVTGDALPDAVKEKLAASDGDVITFVNTLIEKNAGTIDSLGGPSDVNDEAVPQTKKEAAAKAEDQFLSWILQ